MTWSERYRKLQRAIRIAQVVTNTKTKYIITNHTNGGVIMNPWVTVGKIKLEIDRFSRKLTISKGMPLSRVLSPEEEKELEELLTKFLEDKGSN